MKKVGIIGAMQEEVDSLIKIIENKNIIKKNKLEFYTGIHKNQELIIVKCGVGKVNAAMCTQLLIDLFKPDYIINIGVAGAVSDEVNIGDIIISTNLMEHDFDCTAFGYEKGIIPRLDTSDFKADNNLLNYAISSKKNFKNLNVYEGVIVSGDIFVNSKQLKEELKIRYNAMCVEMEGASIAHVCTLNEIPFLVIRSMSDKADGEAPSNFDEFVIQSAENSKKYIENILEYIK